MARSLVVLAVLGFAALAPPATAQTRNITSFEPDRNDYKVARKSTATLQAKLAKLVSFEGISDPNTSLDDALKMLEKRYNIPIDINLEAFNAEGVKDWRSQPIGKAIPKLQSVPLSTVFRLVLERVPSRSGVAFFSRNGVGEISTLRAYRYEIRRDREIVRPIPPSLPGR